MVLKPTVQKPRAQKLMKIIFLCCQEVNENGKKILKVETAYGVRTDPSQMFTVETLNANLIN